MGEERGGGRVPSTAGQNHAVDLVTRPDVENDQRKSTRTCSVPNRPVRLALGTAGLT